MSEGKRSEIDCGEYKLVAEVNPDQSYREIFIGIETDGVWTQDLAIVGQRYHYEEEKTINEDRLSIKIYADANDEDYTHEFKVDLLKEEENK